jgi:hypothetical protein
VFPSVANAGVKPLPGIGVSKVAVYDVAEELIDR